MEGICHKSVVGLCVNLSSALNNNSHNAEGINEIIAFNCVTKKLVLLL